MNMIINNYIRLVNMDYNKTIMDVKKQIKLLAVSRGITLKNLADLMRNATGKDYTYNSLLGKLNRESLSLKEAKLIAKLLNYDLEFINIEK